MNRAGFTLLELSIVLVIIGLIIGGITVGADLIRSAELNSVASDFRKYETAMLTFRLKYNALPGDMENATAYWGDQATGTDACADGTVTDGSPGTCNGNGDGKVTPIFTTILKGESLRAWQHLSLSGILQGGYLGYNSGNNIVLGESVPASQIASAGYFLQYRDDTHPWFGKNNANYITLFSNAANPTRFYEGALTASEAQSIDQKMDDGVADSGKLYGMRGTGESAGCTDNTFTSATGSYVLSSGLPTCQLQYWLD